MPRPLRPALALAVVLLAATIVAPPLHAQQRLGAIQGTIADQTGGVLPGVTVTVTNVETGITRTTITNERGLYRMPSLDPGRYRVAAELSGFRSAETRDVVLSVGAIVRV